MVIEDLDAPRKQRHTARRVWQRLLEEEGAVVAESSVRNLVAGLRVEIAGDHRQVMVPQTHLPAEEGEVDFGEFSAVIAGVVMKLFMFCLRLSHSGKAVHVAYANQTQESFLDGHVRAFEVLGGYVGVDPSIWCCGRAGWPFPSRSVHGLAAAVGTSCRCCGQSRGVAGARRGGWLPGVCHGALPAEHTAVHRLRPEGVLHGGGQGSGGRRHRRLEVRLGATKVLVLDGGKRVAEHVRSLHKGTEDLVLDHYLEVLTRKPGALAGSTALAAARACGAFTGVHQRFWDAARRALGDGPAPVRWSGCCCCTARFTAGMDAALSMSSFDPDVVAVETRRSMLTTSAAPTPVLLPATASEVAAVKRPSPSLAGYDRLLTGATA